MVMALNAGKHGAEQAHLNSKIRMVSPRTLMASMKLNRLIVALKSLWTFGP